MFKQTLTAALTLSAVDASAMTQKTLNYSQTEASVDTQDYTLNVDYCLEPGSVSYSTVSTEDYYFNSDDYQALDASAKLDEIWERLTEEQTIACQQFGGLGDLFR